MNTTKIISACAVLVALASCSSDHELSQQSAEDAAIRIQANVGGSTTRAADNIQGAQFDNGVYVSVYIYEHTDGQATYNYGIDGIGFYFEFFRNNASNNTINDTFLPHYIFTNLSSLFFA